MDHHAARFVTYAALLALGVACSGTGTHHAGGTADANGDTGGTGDAITAPACTPFDVSIPGASIYVTPVWIGDEYVVIGAAGAGMDTILQVVSGDGVPGAQFATIPQSEGTVEVSGHPSAWSGSSLGVLVRSNTANTFELVRFAHDGTRLGQTTMMKDNRLASYANVVWANDRFVVAWIDMSSGTGNILDVQEIGPDGTLGMARQLTATDVGSSFTLLRQLASTSTSYAINVQNLNSPPVAVVIDRTTGTVAHYAPGTEFYNANLVARDPAFALLAGTSPAHFETVDGSAMPGPMVNLPLAGNGTLVPTPSGYHVYDLVSSGGQPPTMRELDAMDLDARGFSTGPESAITTIAQSANGVAGIFRGNGYAAYFEYGSGTTYTLRLMQQCMP